MGEILRLPGGPQEFSRVWSDVDLSQVRPGTVTRIAHGAVPAPGGGWVRVTFAPPRGRCRGHRHASPHEALNCTQLDGEAPGQVLPFPELQPAGMAGLRALLELPGQISRDLEDSACAGRPPGASLCGTKRDHNA